MMQNLGKAGAVAAAALLSLAAGTALGGCSRSDTPTSGKVTEVVQEQASIAAMVPDQLQLRGILQVNLVVGDSPFVFTDEAAAALLDFDVDLANAITTVMGLETASITSIDKDDLAETGWGDADIAMGALELADSVLSGYDVVSYAQAAAQYYIPVAQAEWDEAQSDSDSVLPTPCGYTIGVVADSYEENVLTADSTVCQSIGADPIDIVTYASVAELSTAMGEVDAIFDSAAHAETIAQTSGDAWEAIGELQGISVYVVAVLDEDEQLTVAIQAAVQYLMDSGYLAELLAEYGLDDLAMSTADISARTA